MRITCAVALAVIFATPAAFADESAVTTATFNMDATTVVEHSDTAPNPGDVIMPLLFVTLIGATLVTSTGGISDAIPFPN